MSHTECACQAVHTEHTHVGPQDTTRNLSDTGRWNLNRLDRDERTGCVRNSKAVKEGKEEIVDDLLVEIISLLSNRYHTNNF